MAQRQIIRLVAGGYSDAPAGRRALDAFREGLHRFGLVEGDDYVVDLVFAEGRVDALDDLMLRGVEDVAVLVPLDTRGMGVAHRSGDGEGPLVVTALTLTPVLRGYIQSVDEPGGKINGITVPANALTWTRFQLIKEALPQAERIGVLRYFGQRGEIGEKVRSGEIAAAMNAARAFDMTVEADLWIKGNPATGDHLKEVTETFDRLERERIDALVVFPIPTLNHNLFMVEQRVRNLKVPAIYTSKAYVEAGGLMSYGPDAMTMVRQAAAYVARILRCPPEDRREMVKRMPLEEPRRYELAINLTTARRLGIAPTWGLTNVVANADLVIG